MNSEQREMLRLSLLTIASPATHYGISLEVFRVYLRARGFNCTTDEILAELQYLVEKGFIELCAKPLSPENKLWKITAAGRDYMAVNSL